MVIQVDGRTNLTKEEQEQVLKEIKELLSKIDVLTLMSELERKFEPYKRQQETIT